MDVPEMPNYPYARILAVKGWPVILNDPLLKRGACPIHPWNLNLLNNVEANVVFPTWTVINSKHFYIFFWSIKTRRLLLQKNSQMKLNSFQIQKHWYLIHTWSHKAFKGTIENLTFNSFREGSLEITFTVL